ncbi:MAG: glycoside hydrolase family 16 protein [Alteripontixanthobacter sp.]
MVTSLLIAASIVAASAQSSGEPVAQPVAESAAPAAAPAPATASPPREPHRAPAGYELVFADEFDSGTMPDPARWAYDTHRNAEGWYNAELQYYANARRENARIEGGNLIIEARRERLDRSEFPDFGGQDYSSTRLFTKGKAAWEYGFFEIRAKLPCGRGTWPAIWMLPEADIEWPRGGEIDIMEHVGYDPGVIHQSVHTQAFNFSRGTQKTTEFELPTACEQFHRYQLLWTPEMLLTGVDDQPKFLFKKVRDGQSRWPFDAPMHLLLNIAVGGQWGGRKGIDDTALPAKMEIDHVRVYQLADSQSDPDAGAAK